MIFYIQTLWKAGEVFWLLPLICWQPTDEIGETCNSQLLALSCLSLPIFMQRKVKPNQVLKWYEHDIQGQKHHHHPKREGSWHLTLPRVLILYRLISIETGLLKTRQGIKFSELWNVHSTLVLLIQLLLPQKQQKQLLGAGSYESHLLTGSAGCQPGTAGGDNHHSKYWVCSPATPVLWGKQIKTLLAERGILMENPPQNSLGLTKPSRSHWTLPSNSGSP